MSELQAPEEQSDICKLCGISRIDQSENPKSCLCRSCREEKIRYPLPKMFYVVLVIVIALVSVAMVRFPQSLKMYRTYKDADRNAADGYVADTLIGLNELLKKYPDSLKVALKATDISMEHGYYDYASYFISTYIEGKTLEDYSYSKITRYSDQLNIYYDTLDAIENIYADAIEGAPEDFTSFVQSQLNDLLFDNKYDKALLYFNIGYIEPDNTKRMEYMQECLYYDPTYADATAQIAAIYRRQGDLDKAGKMLESAYRKDRDNSAVLRNLAIIEMLGGNSEQGLIYAETAYNNYPEGDYTADTYITALYNNGQEKEAREFKAECEAKEFYFDEMLDAFLDGSISLQDYYID